MIRPLAALLALAAPSAAARPFAFDDCQIRRPYGGGELHAMQIVEPDGAPGWSRVSWSQSGVAYRISDLPPGRDPAFATVVWTAERPPDDEAALARSLDEAMVTILVVTPKRLRQRPFFRFRGDHDGISGMALGNIAHLPDDFPWAIVFVSWRNLRTYAGPGHARLAYALQRVTPLGEPYRSPPLREGSIDLVPIRAAVDAVPGLLRELDSMREQREGRCRRWSKAEHPDDEESLD